MYKELFNLILIIDYLNAFIMLADHRIFRLVYSLFYLSFLIFIIAL